MYRPKAFAEDDVDAVLEMIDVASLAHVVAHGPDGFESSPLPVLADVRDGVVHLRGHVARPNPLWRLAPCDALAIVPLGDAYISPSWYPSKAADGKVVPTWNYEVVHAHGRLVAHDDVEWLERLVRDLTARHERDNTEPWAVDDAPRDFVEAMLRGIVGVEVVVERLEGKRKLSQNRSTDDQRRVVDRLDAAPAGRTTGSAAVAEAMRRRLDGS
ncbi:MAG: FMN-binding negative transcriptional regulator [Ilumatobacteraceae bacterium]